MSKTSAFFALLLTAAAVYLFTWGVKYTGDGNALVLGLAGLFGLFMAFNIGGNDVANSFGTSVGAGTLSIRQALLVAAVFELSGAVIAGGAVTKTIRQGIVDLSVVPIEPMQLVTIMMAALLAAGLWLLMATWRGYPVSTTHSIVGGIVGGALAVGMEVSGWSSAQAMVQWDGMATITLSWVISPLLGGALSYALFSFIDRRILRYNVAAEEQIKVLQHEQRQIKERHKTAFGRLSEIQQIAYAAAMARDAFDDLNDVDLAPSEPETEYYRDLRDLRRRLKSVKTHRALEDYVPLLATLGAVVIASMVIFKGLDKLNLGVGGFDSALVIAMVAAAVWMATSVLARSMRSKSLHNATFLVFSWLQVFTAAGFAFSHGANDIANAIGPFAAILDVLRSGSVHDVAPLPQPALVAFGVALIAGLWFLGREVIRTVGQRLTEIHPASGFAAELSAAAMVMLASVLGIPVSSTHILIGAVLGVGLVNRKANWALMKPIGLAWIITVPVSVLLGAAFCFVLLRLL